jgi:hypothetical protein
MGNYPLFLLELWVDAEFDALLTCLRMATAGKLGMSYGVSVFSQIGETLLE